MTEEQIQMLRHLIKQEIDAAQIDGMERLGQSDQSSRKCKAEHNRQ